MENTQDFGERVALRLRSGSPDAYHLVQELVARALKTQSWTYGDMIMRIIWALLPDDAQDAIAQPSPRKQDGGEAAVPELAGREQPPPLPVID